MPTLKVKNESKMPLKIDTGGAPIEIAPGAERELTANELKSASFAKALEDGWVSFVKVDQPTEEQIKLARLVLPDLVSAAGDRLAAVKGRFEQSQKELLKLREGYNKAWGLAETYLAGAKSTMPGWPHLKSAAENYLLHAAVEDPKVKELKQTIQDLAEQVAALKQQKPDTPEALEAWFKNRANTEEQLKQAEAELAKMSKAAADPVAAKVIAIDQAASAIGSVLI